MAPKKAKVVPHPKKTEKKKRTRRKRSGGGHVAGTWKGTVFLGYIRGNEVDELRLIHMVHTNPLFAREDDPKVGAQSTPLTMVAAIHQRYRVRKCEVELVSMASQAAYNGSVVYVWRNDTPGLITAQPSLDTLLASSPAIVSLGSNRKVTMPPTAWMDVNTAATETEKWEQYVVQVYITGKTMASFYKDPAAFSGNLWMIYIHFQYEFEEVRPTSLAVMSSKDTETTGAKVVTMPSTSEIPGALALEVTSGSLLHRSLGGDANALTSGQTNAIWEIGDMAVTVASNFLGPFGWILQGGWFVVKKHFSKSSGRNGVTHYLVYPSLVQAQQDNYVTAAPGQDVGTILGKASVQQLTNPNFSGDSSVAFGATSVPLGYPLYLPPTADTPPLIPTLPGRVMILARTHPDQAVLPITDTASTYNWKYKYRLNESAWEDFPVNPQQRACFSGLAPSIYESLLGTECVVMTTTSPTDYQVSYTALWRGSLHNLVNHQVVHDAQIWRAEVGSNVFNGLMFPFYETATTWSAGKPIIFGACWIFVGRRETDIASHWAANYVLPGNLEWEAGLSPKYTMHDGLMGPPILVVENKKETKVDRVKRELARLRLELDEDCSDSSSVSSDIEILMSDGEGGEVSETFDSESGERFVIHRDLTGKVLSVVQR